MLEQAQPAPDGHHVDRHHVEKNTNLKWKTRLAKQVNDICLPTGALSPIRVAAPPLCLHPKEERACDGATD